jgi:hypothetical protein
VVTPDGKTWDQVTRDVSYIGNRCVTTSTNTAYSGSQNIIFDEWRGNSNTNNATFDCYNKDFAIAYDRLICLRDGSYQISAFTIEDVTGDVLNLRLNGIAAANTLRSSYQQTTGFQGHSYSVSISLKRGDFLHQYGGWHPDCDYSRFEIIRID